MDVNVSSKETGCQECEGVMPMILFDDDWSQPQCWQVSQTQAVSLPQIWHQVIYLKASTQNNQLYFKKVKKYLKLYKNWISYLLHA